jgi:hypothetical protein
VQNNLVQGIASPVLKDSELILGFFSPGVFAGMILLLVLINHIIFAEIVLWLRGRYLEHLIDSGRLFRARLIGYGSVLLLVIAHLLEIAIWALSLVSAGLMTSLNQALYYAGSTYTTLGYGTDPFANGRNAITVVIALSGMLCVAVTTSLLISQFSIYHARRHRPPSQ